MTGAGPPEHVRGLDVTDGALSLLGVQPAVGRLFTRRDERPGARNRAALICLLAAKFGGVIFRDRRNPSRLTGSRDRLSACCRRDFNSSIAIRCALIVPIQWDRSKTKLGNFSTARIGKAEAGGHDAAGQRRHGPAAAHYLPQFPGARRLQPRAV